MEGEEGAETVLSRGEGGRGEEEGSLLGHCCGCGCGDGGGGCGREGCGGVGRGEWRGSGGVVEVGGNIDDRGRGHNRSGMDLLDLVKMID